MVQGSNFAAVGGRTGESALFDHRRNGFQRSGRHRTAFQGPYRKGGFWKAVKVKHSVVIQNSDLHNPAKVAAKDR